MVNYTTKDIVALREKTGAGMMDVKKALVEADGDVSKAEEIIRIKGLKGIEKRAGRSASEGLVNAKVVLDGNTETGYVIELNTETDFVAKSPKFIEASHEMLEAISSSKAGDIESAMVSKKGDITVEQMIQNLAAAVSENVILKQVHKVSGEALTLYLHKTAKDLPPAIAVLVATDKNGVSAGKDVAHHIAAYNPQYFSKEEVPSDIIEKEKEIATQIAKEEGKPEKIIPNIVEGRLKGFYKDVVLLEQPLASDPKVTVENFVKSTGGNISGFLRVQLGK